MKKYLICKDIVNDEDYYDTTAYVQTDENAERETLSSIWREIPLCWPRLKSSWMNLKP